MSLIIGNMRRTITVQRLYSTKNQYGEDVQSFVDYITLKAELKNSTGNKALNNNEIFNTLTLTFWTHYRPITTDMRIKFNNIIYEILDIREIGFREGLELVVSRINE